MCPRNSHQNGETSRKDKVRTEKRIFLQNMVTDMECLPEELSTENSVSIKRNRPRAERTHQTKQSISLETLSNNRPISILLLDSQHMFPIGDLRIQIKCKKQLDTRLKNVFNYS
jgi:hypothetical protein